MKQIKRISAFLLISYIIILLCMTVWLRDTIEKPAIHRELFWSYTIKKAPFMTIDSLYNILLFIPIGILIGLLFARFHLIKTVLAGLLLSETIECLQLIFMKGAFDVDDLFNNTLGALIGGGLVVIGSWVKGSWFACLRKVKICWW